MSRSLLAGLTLLSLAACATDGSTGSAPMAGEARADLRNAAGNVVASATATSSGDRVRIRLVAAGLPAGTFGAHVHAVGRCDPPGFESAGPHWNPTGRQHGSQNPQGPHHGDLPNLQVGTDGAGTLEYSLAAASLRGGPAPLFDGDGAAIVVHAGPDDYRTDPSGNSGARIACGVFE
ncbi:superoxide dismutase family protein [Sphingosinicella terrae]|uniref:superoxide dismutase family protein n=1 Tax=Sphingosinicella terrae TaxID=2172047 RepID=UPI000E0D001A|nr:superoxide dismutase family protein [Sphingosinicella terrae]